MSSWESPQPETLVTKVTPGFKKKLYTTFHHKMAVLTK